MVFNGLPDNVLVTQNNRLDVSAHYIITKNIIVLNRKRVMPEKLLSVILHEVYHCHQVFRGDLSWSRKHWCLLWKGQPVTGQQHDELPWEAEVDEKHHLETLISLMTRKDLETLSYLLR